MSVSSVLGLESSLWEKKTNEEIVQLHAVLSVLQLGKKLDSTEHPASLTSLHLIISYCISLALFHSVCLLSFLPPLTPNQQMTPPA